LAAWYELPYGGAFLEKVVPETGIEGFGCSGYYPQYYYCAPPVIQ
jgi:hypothetical protein